MLTPSTVWPERNQIRRDSQSSFTIHSTVLANGQSPYTAGVTPIFAASKSFSMHSQRSTHETEALDPTLDASFGAYAAIEQLSPTGDARDKCMKSEAKDGEAMLMKRPSMPDNGPAMNFRNCGA